MVKFAPVLADDSALSHEIEDNLQGPEDNYRGSLPRACVDGSEPSKAFTIQGG
jgi:hypothetical protein